MSKKKQNLDKPYGPFDFNDTRKFASRVVGGHEDSVNDRFDLTSVATELEGKAFDSAELWETLETFRLQKWDKHVYSL